MNADELEHVKNNKTFKLQFQFYFSVLQEFSQMTYLRVMYIVIESHRAQFHEAENVVSQVSLLSKKVSGAPAIKMAGNLFLQSNTVLWLACFIK